MTAADFTILSGLQFTATQVEVRANTGRARAALGGDGIVGATLRKSGFLELSQHCAENGMTIDEGPEAWA